jgi:hypothetical protein
MARPCSRCVRSNHASTCSSVDDMMPAKKRTRTTGPTQVGASPPSSAGACPPFTAGALPPSLGSVPDELAEAGAPNHRTLEKSARANTAPRGIPGGCPLGAASTALAAHGRVPGLAGLFEDVLFEDQKVNALSREKWKCCLPFCLPAVSLSFLTHARARNGILPDRGAESGGRLEDSRSKQS